MGSRRQIPIQQRETCSGGYDHDRRHQDLQRSRGTPRSKGGQSGDSGDAEPEESDVESPSDTEEAVPVCEPVTVASVSADQSGGDEGPALVLVRDPVGDVVGARPAVERFR